MTETVDNATYLVLSATGRQGKATINALLAKGITSIVASSRNPTTSNSAKALLELEGVTKLVKADFNDVESVVTAIKESGATHLWFTTDFWSIPFFSRTAKTETKLGSNVIDAVKKAGTIKHVVYSSVGDADSAPEALHHFWGKAGVEKYMAAELDVETTTWSVIRPVAFFENVDDPASKNPLKKGRVRMLTKADKPVKYIACADIGKGSAVLLTEASKYKGTVTGAAGGCYTGTDLAKVLTEASGTVSVYSMSSPRMALRIVSKDLYHMANWFEETGYSVNIEDFKKIVPDAMDAKAFFVSKGKWANGEVFESMKETKKEVEDKGEGAKEKVEEKVEEKAEEVTEEVEEKAEEATEKEEEVTEEVEEKAEEVTEKVEEKAEEVTEEVEEKAEEVTEKVEEKAEDVTEEVEEKAEEAEEQDKETKEEEQVAEEGTNKDKEKETN